MSLKMDVTITYSKTMFDAKTHNQDNKELCRMLLHFWLSKVVLKYQMLSLKLLLSSTKVLKNDNKSSSIKKDCRITKKECIMVVYLEAQKVLN